MAFDGEHSELFSFSFLPLLLVQCSLLHPAYQSDPSARLIRILLAPIIIAIAISTQSRKLFLPLDDFLHLNYAIVAVPTFHVCCLAIQFAFHHGPCLKPDVQGDISNQPAQPSDLSASNSSKEQPSPSDHPPTIKSKAPTTIPDRELVKTSSSKLQIQKSSPSVFNLIKFSLAIVSSPRGLEYTWAPPPGCLSPVLPRKPLGRFIYESCIGIINNHIQFLICSAYILKVSGHRSGALGWILDTLNLTSSTTTMTMENGDHDHDHQPQNLFSSMSMSMSISKFLINQFTAFVFTYLAICAFTLLGLILDLVHILFISISRACLPFNLRPDPIDTSLYPPMFNKLGSRYTLSDFWGKGWQCAFRRDFTFCGGLPLQHLGTFFFGSKVSRAFSVMGSMIFSGFFHEWGILTVSKPDWKFNTMNFFIIQGVGLLIEDRFLIVHQSKASDSKHQPKKDQNDDNPRGRNRMDRRTILNVPLSYILTYSWLCITSQGMFDTLRERGVGRAGIIESDFRNWYWFQYLLPFGPFLPKGLMFKTTHVA